MYTKDFREPKFFKVITKMDPDCAICRAPASAGCDCEARGLEVAVTQAEQRMMQPIYEEIKSWVRAHARDYILDYFSLLKERRLQTHEQTIERIKSTAYYYNVAPHPGEIQAAQDTFKHGIDEDWQSSVQRYPEVLEYFYSLVNLTLPRDDDPNVRDPPLSALSGSRKTRRAPAAPPPATIASGPESVGAPTPTNRISAYGLPSSNGHGNYTREIRGRTPPPPPATDRIAPLDRRTPAPQRDRRSSFRPPPPPPPSTYYPSYNP